MRYQITFILMLIGERFTGPMSFRLYLQPLMASLLAVRAGLADAREGRPAYLWTLVSSRSDRAGLLRDGWSSVGRVFALAVIMDVIYQLIVYQWIYPLQVLFIATALAIVPYILLRGPVNRLASLRAKKVE
jgi:hypothetical protein